MTRVVPIMSTSQISLSLSQGDSTLNAKVQEKDFFPEIVARCSYPPKPYNNNNHHMTCVCESTAIVAYVPKDVIILCPLAQQCHEHRTQQDTNNHKPQRLIILCAYRIEQKVAREQLDQSSI